MSLSNLKSSMVDVNAKSLNVEGPSNINSLSATQNFVLTNNVKSASQASNPSVITESFTTDDPPKLQQSLTNNSSLVNDGVIFSAYGSQPPVKANSLQVFCPANWSKPLNGSYADHTQVNPADAITGVLSMTNGTLVVPFLAGLTGTVGATAVAPPTINNIVPGTGFTINGTPGAIYRYLIYYA